MAKYLRPRVLLLLFVLGGLLGGTAFSGSGETALSESEAAAVDAQSYADDFGVTLNVALERLAIQEKLGEAIVELSDRESETYAGAWVEHSPEWRMVVRTTASGPSDQTVAEYFSESTIPVTVKRDAPWSYQQTRQNIQAIEGALEGVVDEYLLYVNPREPKGIALSLRIPDDMSDATEEDLGRLLPALVADKSASLGWTDGPILHKADVYGGASTQKRNTNEFWCTLGFSVETSGGTTGLVTSEHCSPDGNINLDYYAPDGTEYEMTYVHGRNDDLGDFAWFTTGEVEDNRIYAPHLRSITSYEDDYEGLNAGRYVCRYGRVTNRECDVVHGRSDQVDNLVIMVNKESDFGDSGGPWFHVYRAYGVHVGWIEEDDGTLRDVWSSVAFLEDSLSVTVLTD